MAKQITPNSWDRRIDETETAYADFKIFLEMGEKRTVSGASKISGKDRKQLHNYSHKFDWRARARDYDIAMEQSALAARRKDIRKVQMVVIEDASFDYRTMLAKWRMKMDDPELSIDQLAKLIEMRDKIDKMARRVVELPTTFKYIGKPDEEDSPFPEKQLTWGVDNLPMLVEGSVNEDDEDEFEDWQSTED